MAITVEQIHAKASELHAQGIKPTQTNVRNALGGGSFSTISEALRTWRAEQDTNAQLAEVVIPDEVMERTELLTAQIWDIAQKIANDRLTAKHEALDHAKALAQTELDEMTAVVTMLEQEQAELLKQVEVLEANAKELQAQNDELQTKADNLAVECSHLNDKLTNEQNHSRELKTALDELTGENKSMIKEIAQLKTHNEHKNDEIKRLTMELANKEQERQNQSATAKAHQEHSDKIKAELSDLIRDNAKLQGKLEISADNQAKADSTIKEQAERIADLSALVAELKAINAKAPAEPQ